jgi:hypothetical protein
VILSNEMECDEAYVVAGHKGQPEVVKHKGRKVVDADAKVKVDEARWRRKDPLSLG